MSGPNVHVRRSTCLQGRLGGEGEVSHSGRGETLRRDTSSGVVSGHPYLPARFFLPCPVHEGSEQTVKDDKAGLFSLTKD